MRKTALITGATSGIGYELAKTLAQDNCDLVLVSRNIGKMEAIKAQFEADYGVTVHLFAIDLIDQEAPLKVFNFTQSQGITVDILINNAGFGDFGPFHDANIKRQNDMIHLNVLALMNLTYLYVQPMVEKGAGYILNVASTAAFQAGPIMSIYYATKAFVLSFTEAIAVELKPKGITVSALCPGPTTTNFFENANLGRSNLFKNLKTTSAGFVSQTGYAGLLKGKTIIIPGFTNKALILASKFLPRCLVRQAILRIQK